MNESTVLERGVLGPNTPFLAINRTRGIGPQLLPHIVDQLRADLCSSHVCYPIPKLLGVVRVWYMSSKFLASVRSYGTVVAYVWRPKRMASNFT